MIRLLGEYDVTLDAKGRFLLPAGYKKQLAEVPHTQFVINRGFEKCLTLYPMHFWEPLHEKIAQLNDFDPKVREFRRFFLNGATIIELDSAGRLNLPNNLMEYAGLKKDIVLSAATNKIEIWDKARHDELLNNLEPVNYSEVAFTVLGGKPSIDLPSI
jgi:MraZ protein